MSTRLRLAPVASRWLPQVLTVLVTGLITVAGSAGSTHRTGRPFDLVAFALLAIASLASGLARAWPGPSVAAALAATAAYFALGYAIDSPFFIALAVTAYRSAAPGTRARARTAVVAVVTPAVFAAIGRLTPTADPTAGLLESVVVVVALLAGQARAEWRMQADDRARQASEEESQRRMTEERLRIARELHDVVSHSISLINVQAGVAVHVMEQRPEEARAALIAIRAVSRDALRDLRGILGLLRSTDDAEPRSPAAGLAQVPALADSVRRAGVRVAVDLDDATADLPASVDLTAYRVIQEALTNVVRHAPGAAATVTVRRDAGALRVAIDDEGRPASGAPAEPRAGPGHGLAGMRERVRAAGGSLEVGARTGGGFSVRAMLPLEGEPA